MSCESMLSGCEIFLIGYHGIRIQYNLKPRCMWKNMYTIVPEAEVNTGEYSLVYKPRRSRGLYN